MSHFIAALLIALLTVSASAQEKPQDKSISARTSGLQKMDGVIPLYWDAAGGKLLMEISRFDTEFLYQVSLPTQQHLRADPLEEHDVGATELTSIEPNRIRADAEGRPYRSDR
jgi:hypothetical protein